MIGILATASALGAVTARAQGRVPEAPLLGDMNPPSAKSGTAVEVTLTGQRLAGTKQLLCRYSAFPERIAPVERGVKADVLSATDGQVKAKITVAADAPDGLHEVRACAAQGITNPLYFFVSQYDQTPEKEPNNSRSEANPVTLPTTLGGAIQQGEDQDHFCFEAKAGEQLTFQVEGFKRFAPPQNNQQGIQYLDSFLILSDASGNELATDDDSSRLDAFLAYQFPSAGRYYLTIRDSLYRGRGDFHYRLTIGRQPVVTAVLPPGGARGKRYNATIFGYNLDGAGATSVKRFITLPETLGVDEFRVTSAEGTSNGVPVVSLAYPEMSEVEPNDRVQDGTQVILPTTCTGKFDRPEDADGFRFQGQSGQRLVFELLASQLGSPVDTFLTLQTRGGKVVARSDDSPGPGGRTIPDSRMEVTLPSSEEYCVTVRNQLRSGAGPQCFYLLTIRPQQPGFSVTYRQQGINEQGAQAMVPVDSITVPRGGGVEFEVALGRYEGQGGDVGLGLNMPPDVKGLVLDQVTKTDLPLPPGASTINRPQRTTYSPTTVIKNGQGSGLFRLSAPKDMAPGTYFGGYMRLSGSAGSQPYVVNQPLWVTVAPEQ